MSGAGNDFVVIDNRDFKLKADVPSFVRVVTRRRVAIGADGLVLLEPSDNAEFRMKYYNADGSYGGMCGNAARCIARFAFLNGIAKVKMSFEALDKIYAAEVISDSLIRLAMPEPRQYKLNFPIPVEVASWKQVLNACFADTGSPHVVINIEDIEKPNRVNDVERVDILTLGKAIREHPDFLPEGTNVNFVQVLPDGTVKMRSYERGVEDETLACGTGAIASAIISSVQKRVSPPIKVLTRSGEYLVVGFRFEGEQVRDLCLEGSARVVYHGELQYDEVNGVLVG